MRSWRASSGLSLVLLLCHCAADEFQEIPAEPGVAGAGGQSGASGSSGAPTAGGGQGGKAQGGAGGKAQGGAGQAGASGQAGVGGQAGASGGGSVYFVNSAQSDDSGNGLTPQTAFQTLQQAVAQAQGGDEIRICAGQYDLEKTLDLGVPLTLRGGYDCVKFEPTPVASSPCATPLAPVVLTGMSSPLLRISNEKVVLDQVIITGPGTPLVESLQAPMQLLRSQVLAPANTSASASAVAVKLTGGEPVLTGNCIQAGFATGTAPAATLAVLIEDGSTAQLAGNDLDGGSGIGKDAYGSVGVFIREASPELRNNTIKGGLGSSQNPFYAGSAAVVVYAPDLPGKKSAPLLTENNKLEGGSGQGAKMVTGSIGLDIFCEGKCSLDMGGKGSVSGNTIHGGQGSSPELAVSTTAVRVRGGAKVDTYSLEVSDNTIIGGDPTSLPTTNGGRGLLLGNTTVKVRRNTILGGKGAFKDSAGIEAYALLDSDIDNNMIHGGSIDGSSYGIVLGAGKNIQIRHNTIVSSGVGQIGIGISLIQVLQSPESQEVPLPADVEITNNLLIGPGGAFNRGVSVVHCGPVPLNIKGTAMVGYGDQAFVFDPINLGKCPSDTVSFSLPLYANICGCSSDESLELVGGSCSPAIHCQNLEGCNDATSCAKGLFESWSDDDAGYSAAMQGATGWRLRPELLCKVQATSKDAKVMDDRYRMPRSPPFSRGAHEQGCK